MTKNDLFEYVVYKLDQWYKETHEGQTLQITKLRLQKILFLLCAVNATKKEHGLLSIFDRFVALPLGPVEMDIYEAMKSNQFNYIRFDGDDCRVGALDPALFKAARLILDHTATFELKPVPRQTCHYFYYQCYTKPPFHLTIRLRYLHSIRCK